MLVTCLLACMTLTDLDKTTLEQHLHHLLQDGQNAAVVHSQSSLQHVLHVEHLSQRQTEIKLLQNVLHVEHPSHRQKERRFSTQKDT